MRAFTDGENPGLYVVTVEHDGERDGCLVGFATQCSILPERYLVCLSVLNRTFTLARHADVLAVHRLGEEQLDLARRFGSERGEQLDKFAGLGWHRGAGGAPLLENCAALLEGSIQARLPLGDHWGFVLAPLWAEAGTADGALRLAAVDFEAGHPPEEVRA